MNAKENDKLTEAEIELISAFIDGELDDDVAARVQRRIEHDPAWSRQAQSFQQLDDILGKWPTETVGSDFSHKLKRSIHRRRPATYLRWAAPLATAACIAAVAWLSLMMDTPGKSGPIAHGDNGIAEVIAALPEQDRFVIENLDWLEDYDVLTNFETIEAIEKMDTRTETAVKPMNVTVPLAMYNWQ